MNDKQKSFCRVVENAISYSISYPKAYVTVLIDSDQHSQFIASNMPHYRENMVHAINRGYCTVFDVHGGSIEV